MTVLEKTLFKELADIGSLLDGRAKNAEERSILRKRLAKRVGSFYHLEHLDAAQIKDWAGEKPLAAVDGSVNKVGGSFPYIIYFFQALAKTTHNQAAVRAEIFTPLVPKNFNEVMQVSEESGLTGEYALNLQKDRKLTALELKCAVDAVERYRPFLVIFDGGFLRFSRHAPALWKEYQKTALEQGVLSVGVIEEIASSGLSAALKNSCGVFREDDDKSCKDDKFCKESGCASRRNGGKDTFPEDTFSEDTYPHDILPYDRELLYGLLNPGECLLPHKNLEIKSKYYTAFARLSGVPQAIACDFLTEQADQARRILQYLYTITPGGSRGIPLFLDIVDAETRLAHEDLTLLIDTYLDAGAKERFFTVNRERRDY